MRYLIVLFLIVGLLSCKDEKEPDLNENSSDIIAYFPLDSNFADSSGNGTLLKAFGSPEFTEGYRNKPSTAVLLDGDDDFLIGLTGKLDTFSISMWLKSNRYYVGEWPQWRSTLFDYSSKQVYGSIDGISGATQIKYGIKSEQVASTDIDNCTDWFHLYMAVSNDVKIYLNGNLSKTVPLQHSITFLNDTIYFGRSSTDDEIKLTYFYGKLDEIMIFNRILDQAEIDELSFK